MLQLDLMGLALTLGLLLLWNRRQLGPAPSVVAVLLGEATRVLVVLALQGGLSHFTVGGVFSRWHVLGLPAWVPGLLGPGLLALVGELTGGGFSLVTRRYTLLAAGLYLLRSVTGLG